MFPLLLLLGVVFLFIEAKLIWLAIDGVGGMATLLWVLGTFFVGWRLCKRGAARALLGESWRSAPEAWRSGRFGEGPRAQGLLTALAGACLILPGPVADLAGLILLLPPVRRWLLRKYRRWLERSFAISIVELHTGSTQRARDQVVDLRADEPGA